jgi:hypothetical protein
MLLTTCYNLTHYFATCNEQQSFRGTKQYIWIQGTGNAKEVKKIS